MWLETGNDPEAWLLACFALLSVWIAASLFFKLFGGLILFCGSSAGLAVGFLKHLCLGIRSESGRIWGALSA